MVEGRKGRKEGRKEGASSPPLLSPQVGTTLENTERPKCHSSQECQSIIQKLEPSERPLDLAQEFSDPKCRFFWRMATPPPYESEYKGLHMPNVIPEGFEDVWENKCESYGKLLKVSISFSLGWWN